MFVHSTKHTCAQATTQPASRNHWWAISAFFLALFMATATLINPAVSTAQDQPPESNQQNADQEFQDNLRNGGGLTDEQKNIVSTAIDDISGGNLDSTAVNQLRDNLQFPGFSEFENISDAVGLEKFQDLINNDEFMANLGNAGLDPIASTINGNLDALNDATDIAGIGDAISQSFNSQSLMTEHTPSDLLASVMFSRSPDNTLDEQDLSLDELRRYPAANDENKRYGELTEPTGENYNPIGSQLGTYIDGIYRNQWLATKDQPNSFTGENWATRTIDDHTGGPDKVSRSAEGVVSEGAARVGELMQKIYEGSMAVVDFIISSIRSVNILYIFGLADREDPGNSDTNFVVNFVSTIFSGLGLNESSIVALQWMMFTAVVGIFTIILIWAFTRINRVGEVPRMSRVKNYFARIFVILGTIPIALMLTSTVDGMLVPMKDNAMEAEDHVNSRYILDSLDWAALTNMSLGPAGVSNFAMDDPSVYEPTTDQVYKLNTYMSNLVPNSTDEDALGKFNSGMLVNVGDYFAIISNLDSASGVPALTTPFASDITTRGTKQAPYQSQAYFLADLNKSEDTSESGDGGDSGGDSGGDDQASDGDQAADSVDGGDKADTGRKITIGGQEFNLGTGEMSASLLKWNRPETYIYGAVPAGAITTQHKEFGNYIYDESVSKQDWDPEEGKANKDVDEEKKPVLQGNAATIALWNRYAGVQDSVGGGMPSLSTQSVTFLLQSQLGNRSLAYKGFDTVASSAGSAKNTGVSGNEFYRFTVPASSDEAYVAKLGALSTQWIAGGIIAVVALFALLRSPILKALFMMVKGFFQALFTGNVAGLLTYALYFTAMRLSMMFVYVAISAGVTLASDLMSTFGVAEMAGATGELINEVTGPLDWEGLGGDTVSALGTVVVSILMAIALCIPVIKMPDYTKGKVGTKKVSAISVVVILPYLLADQCAGFIDRVARIVGHNTKLDRFYGSPKFMSPEDHKAENIANAGRAMNIAGNIATVVPGGGVVKAGAKLAKVAGGVAGKLAGKGKGKGVDLDPDNPDMPTVGDTTGSNRSGGVGDVASSVIGGTVGGTASNAFAQDGQDGQPGQDGTSGEDGSASGDSTVAGTVGNDFNATYGTGTGGTDVPGGTGDGTGGVNGPNGTVVGAYSYGERSDGESTTENANTTTEKTGEQSTDHATTEDSDTDTGHVQAMTVDEMRQMRNDPRKLSDILDDPRELEETIRRANESAESSENMAKLATDPGQKKTFTQNAGEFRNLADTLRKKADDRIGGLGSSAAGAALGGAVSAGAAKVSNLKVDADKADVNAKESTTKASTATTRASSATTKAAEAAKQQARDKAGRYTSAGGVGDRINLDKQVTGTRKAQWKAAGSTAMAAAKWPFTDASDLEKATSRWADEVVKGRENRGKPSGRSRIRNPWADSAPRGESSLSGRQYGHDRYGQMADNQNTQKLLQAVNKLSDQQGQMLRQSQSQHHASQEAWKRMRGK